MDVILWHKHIKLPLGLVWPRESQKWDSRLLSLFLLLVCGDWPVYICLLYVLDLSVCLSALCLCLCFSLIWGFGLYLLNSIENILWKRNGDNLFQTEIFNRISQGKKWLYLPQGDPEALKTISRYYLPIPTCCF